MSKGVIVGIVVVVAIVVALPFVAKMGKGEDQGVSESAPAAQPAPQPAPAAPAPAPAPAPTAGPQLNAQSLVGTAWEYEGYRLELEPNGQAKVYLPGMVPGPNVQGLPAQWSVNGAQFTVNAMGNTIEGQISGNQIVSPEGTITRVR